MKDAITLTDVQTIDTAEIEELHQLRIDAMSLTEDLKTSEKTIDMKNTLIYNLTQENEKLKGDINGLINNKQDTEKNLKMSLIQKNAQLEMIEIDVLDKMQLNSESTVEKVNKLSQQLSQALQENQLSTQQYERILLERKTELDKNDTLLTELRYKSELLNVQ